MGLFIANSPMGPIFVAQKCWFGVQREEIIFRKMKWAILEYVTVSVPL